MGPRKSWSSSWNETASPTAPTSSILRRTLTGRSRTLYLVYLGILSVAGGLTIFLATSKIGPGVSTDAAMMLSTAENVLRGHGLVDYRGVVLTQFPPLYSLILALGGLIFRQDVFTIGWGLAILVFAATIWLSGLY